MKYNSRYIFAFSVIVTFLVSVVALFIVFNDEKSYVGDKDVFHKLTINGTYFVEGKTEKTDLPMDNKLNLTGRNKVVITGNFNDDIPVNRLVVMKIENLRVNIFINGELVYGFGERNTFPTYAKSPGNVWDRFKSHGIKSTDNVVITLSNMYTNNVDITYENFFNNFYYGYENELIIKNVSESLPNSFLSIFIICLGIAAIFLCFLLHKMKKTILQTLCFAFLSICSGVWFFINFNVQSYFNSYPVLNNSLDFISLCMTSVFLNAYFAVTLKNKWRKTLLYNAYGNLILIIVSTIGQLTGIMDYYDFMPVMNVLITTGVVFLGTSLFLEVRKYPGAKTQKIIFSTVIICISVFADFICTHLEIIPYMIWFKLGFLGFMVLQFVEIAQSIQEVANENTKITILRELAYKDGLTRVKNRTSYLEDVAKINDEINTKKIEFAVIVFDVNNLKTINDSLGHEFGDIMIKGVANVLSIVFKEENIYRIGGDEFVVILKESDCERYKELLKQVDIETERYNANDVNHIEISFAKGIGIYNRHLDLCYREVFERADSAMYDNKQKMKRGEKYDLYT